MIEKEVLRKNVKIALIPSYSSKNESVFVWQVTDRTVHTHKHTFHEKKLAGNIKSVYCKQRICQEAGAAAATDFVCFFTL